MQTYGDFAPTQFDRKGAFLPDRQHWLVAPVGTNRDAGCLPRSNWTMITTDLDTLDPDCKDHEEHTFNHWGPGWFSIILVRPGSPCADRAAEWEETLADYPVADEEHFSNLEWEEAEQRWEDMTIGDRIHALNKCGLSIFSARRDYLPEDLNGALFDYLRS